MTNQTMTESQMITTIGMACMVCIGFGVWMIGRSIEFFRPGSQVSIVGMLLDIAIGVFCIFAWHRLTKLARAVECLYCAGVIPK